MTPPVAGYTFWADPSDASSITLNGSNVSQWNDKSATASNLTQGTAAKQPDYTHTHPISGLNVVTFNGTSHWMSSSVSVVTAQPFTWFVVVENTDTTATQRDCVMTSTDGRIYRDSSDNINLFAGSVANSGSTWGHTAYHYIAGVFNGASSVVTVDGGAATSVSPGAAGGGSVSLATFEAGGTELWQGGIGEIILYPSALSTANRQSVESYLNNKWFTAGTPVVFTTQQSGFTQPAPVSSPQLFVPTPILPLPPVIVQAPLATVAPLPTFVPFVGPPPARGPVFVPTPPASSATPVEGFGESQGQDGFSEGSGADRVAERSSSSSFSEPPGSSFTG